MLPAARRSADKTRRFAPPMSPRGDHRDDREQRQPATEYLAAPA
jgi:hypothetical protein